MALATSLLLLAGLFIVFKVIQHLVTVQPSYDLAHIPGPWYARWTSLVFNVSLVIPAVHPYVDSLHKKYGPIVRITPDMVAVADPDGVADIYKASRGYLKGPIYDLFVEGFFSERDPAVHGRSRRLFARPLANSFLQSHWADDIRQRVEIAVQRLKQEAQTKGEGDVYKWWTIMANDVVTQLSFGESLNMLESEDQSFMETFKNMLRCYMLTRRFPWLMWVLRVLPIKRMEKLVNAQRDLEKYTDKAVANFRAQSKQGDTSHNLFTQIVAQADEKDADTVRGITDKNVHEEAVALTLGGTDSTAATLTFLIWAVLSHPTVRDQLQDEVASLSPELTYNELEQAPLLNAVIHEALRMHGPVSVGLQRVVPASGAKMAGFDLPPGTIVWPQMYSTRNSDDIWPDAMRFDPSRFLGELTPAQKKTYVPFGGGTRSCLGINLAYLELRFAVGTFFRELRGAEVSSSMTEKDMAPNNFFVSSPKGRKLLITIP